MGFTTKNEDTKRKTFYCRTDVNSFIKQFSDEQAFDESDVINRALMYYAKDYYNGELEDPMVRDDMSKMMDKQDNNDNDGTLRNLFNRGDE